MVMWKALLAPAAVAVPLASAFMPASARLSSLRLPSAFGGIARSLPCLPLHMAPADWQSAEETAKAALEPLLDSAVNAGILQPGALDAMKGMRGVITAYYTEGITDIQGWLDQVLTRVTSKRTTAQPAGTMTADRARAALATYLVKYRRRAVIVIEINSEVTPHTLCEILLAAKQLGFDEMLATFVIVVSASRSALGVPIGLSELRVRRYSAPDFTEAEAHQYIQQRLPKFPGIAANITSLVGEHAMHLVEVSEACREAKSAEECVEHAHAYREVGVRDAQDTLRNFIAIAKKNGTFSKDDSRLFLEQLRAGKPALFKEDACVAFGFTELDTLLAALAKWHAFVIDPFKKQVSMQSHFMWIAMGQYLQEQKQQHAKQQQQAGEQ
ncbi:hypothetical protein JKP88DRAFT_292111 [Tribonema minus]|uniref:Uncharacterized protein n=1 Tax=Tribonema minus TaxID=303371 RepID=A0A836CPB3_9STRA|nr:hypothetical protein JKP88DRAFT_292111 [Tribonema minus]